MRRNDHPSEDDNSSVGDMTSAFDALEARSRDRGSGSSDNDNDDDNDDNASAFLASAEDVTRVTMCESQEECPICLDEFTPKGHALFTAACGHKFHYDCLLQNINHDEANADKCPICRRPQTQWPEHTEGLKNAHPHCTQCGKKGTGGAVCEACGKSLAHTPTAAERARAAAAAETARNNLVVECPTCQVRCLVSTSARGTLQCPNGHLFQVRMPPHSSSSQQSQLPPPPRQTRQTPYQARQQARQTPMHGNPDIRQCSSCQVRVQMPRGSQPGQYMCPQGHTFHYRP